MSRWVSASIDPAAIDASASGATLCLRGEILGVVRAVLFDKDGTLSHSEPTLIALARARVSACKQHIAPEQQAEMAHLLERAYGLQPGGLNPNGTTAVASRSHNLISTATALCQVGLGWPQALAISEEVFAASDELHRSGVLPSSPTTAGIERLLAQLERAQVSCAVISNDEMAGIESFLAKHQLSHHFQACWSAEQRPCKPDPEAVLRLCEQLGVPPSACALIGDADSDLAMATGAGVGLVLGYGSGWSEAPRLNPDHPLIGHWSELEVWGPQDQR